MFSKIYSLYIFALGLRTKIADLERSIIIREDELKNNRLEPDRVQAAYSPLSIVKKIRSSIPLPTTICVV